MECDFFVIFYDFWLKIINLEKVSKSDRFFDVFFDFFVDRFFGQILSTKILKNFAIDFFET